MGSGNNDPEAHQHTSNWTTKVDKILSKKQISCQIKQWRGLYWIPRDGLPWWTQGETLWGVEENQGRMGKPRGQECQIPPARSGEIEIATEIQRGYAIFQPGNQMS